MVLISSCPVASLNNQGGFLIYAVDATYDIGYKILDTGCRIQPYKIEHSLFRKVARQI